MSMAKVPSKPKDGQDDRNGTPFPNSFALASMIFQEIESILESELADTPHIVANYDHNSRMKSKRKRGGPFLIKPLNKSKARKTLNGMDYDPVLGVWVGNEDIMKSFAGHQPALIANKNRSDKFKAVGKMQWDGIKWRGNEKELRAFDRRRPPIITALRNDVARSLGADGKMVYDVVTGMWIGNDDDVALFPTDDSLKDDGFCVGSEFQLSPTLTQLFMDCAAKHKATLSGWWQDEKSRTHLHAIRTMSIVRMVRDVKRSSYSFYEGPSDMDIATDNQPPLLPRPDVVETDFEDAWDDMGPFDGSARLKVPDVENPVDIDFELDQELNKDEKKSNRSSVKKDTVEDWGDDFNEQDFHTKISLKAATGTTTGNAGTVGTVGMPPTGTSEAPAGTSGMAGTITQLGSGVANSHIANAAKERWAIDKKPFALLKSDAPNRRSFIFPGSAKKTKEASDEDDELGLEIPTEPLKLKITDSRPVVPDDDAFVDLDDAESDQELPDHDHDEEPFEVDVEEEDWNDVDVPSTLGDPITKRPIAQQPPPEKEVWDDFEIPTEKLALKLSQQKMRQPSRKSKNKEDWDDLEIPENFQLRLKRK